MQKEYKRGGGMGNTTEINGLPTSRRQQPAALQIPHPQVDSFRDSTSPSRRFMSLATAPGSPLPEFAGLPAQQYHSPSINNSSLYASHYFANFAGTAPLFIPSPQLHYATSNPLLYGNSTVPSSGRRRQNSQSPDRGQDNARSSRGSYNNGYWSRSGKRTGNNTRKQSFTSNNNSNNLPSKPLLNPEPSSQASDSHYRRPSTSVPSTPQFARKMTKSARSPSPSRAVNGSPQSTTSEPAKPAVSSSSQLSCPFETALVHSRRRMPYDFNPPLGTETVRQRLTDEEEEQLTKRMMEIVEDLQPTTEIEAQREGFIKKLEGILNTAWPGRNIRVRAFGSTENSLSSKDSDVDVCIRTDWEEGLKPVCKVADVLHKAGMQKVICVSGAKVPIVKIWDPEFRIACDMNINVVGAMENTRMIKTYVDIDPRVRPLCMIIKHWTKMRILNDAAGGQTLSSYTWTCLVLNFLQTRDPPILPSLHARQHKPRTTEDGQVLNFDDNIEALRGFGQENEETLGGLLYAFFRKYGYEFDWEHDAISVREGNVCKKSEKPWLHAQNNGLCVEEPFNTSRNLGNTADDFTVHGLRLELRRACKALAESVDLDEACKKFEFPNEPTSRSHFIPSAPASHRSEVRITQPSSRGGRQGGSRGRNYNGFGRHNGYRRPSNASQYSNGYGAQQQSYPHTEYAYSQATGDQYYSALLQAQQLQGYHLDPRTLGGYGMANGVNVESLHSLSQLPALFPYAYTQMFGITPFFYQQHLSQPTTSNSTPASPGPSATNLSQEGRMRASRNNSYQSATNRSQSQPPRNSYVPPPRSGTSYRQGPVVPPSDDEADFGDVSSNGSGNRPYGRLNQQPETPPEDATELYAGFYTYGGPFHPDFGQEQVILEQEPFMDQKEFVDRQKRLSSGDLPKPDFAELRKSSHPPSPLILDGEMSGQVTPSPINSAVEESFDRLALNSQNTVYSDEFAIESPSASSAVEDAREACIQAERAPDLEGLKTSKPSEDLKASGSNSTKPSASPKASAATTSATVEVPKVSVAGPETNGSSWLKVTEEPKATRASSPRPSPKTRNKNVSKKAKSRNTSQEDLSKAASETKPQQQEKKEEGRSHHGRRHHHQSNGNKGERSVEHQPPPTPASEPKANGTGAQNKHNNSHGHGSRQKAQATEGADQAKKTNSTSSKKSSFNKIQPKKRKKPANNTGGNQSNTTQAQGASTATSTASERKGG